MDTTHLVPKQNSFREYLSLIRINRPIGILLLLWPTLSALWLASSGSPQLKNIIIFSLGAIIMRSAGCIINDVADINFDNKVKRTKDRPLTSRKISRTNALYFFVFLLSIALILVINLNIKTFFLSLIALGLTILYPFMKRVTHYPQFILGLAFSMSIPMAYAAENNLYDIENIIILFAATTLWAMVYDTEYAMVDQDDDIKIGIKSTAIYFDNYTALFIGLLQCIIISLYIYLGVKMSFSRLYFINLTISAVLFIRQLQLIKNKEPKKCFKAFLNNNYFGLFIFLGIFLEFLCR